MYAPWKDRHFGVEMEINGSTVDGQRLGETAIRAAITAARTRQALNSRDAGYYHSNGRTWDVKTDASCGWEIASPVLTLDEQGHNADLMAVCQQLTALRPSIDRRTGLHVHVSLPDFSWKELQALLRLWTRYEAVMFEMIPPGRRNNNYCKALRSSRWTGGEQPHWPHNVKPALAATSASTFASLLQLLDRGMAINLSHWWMNHRIEFRLHSGTVNYDKIRRWLMWIGALIGRAKQQATKPIQPMGRNPQEGIPTDYLGKVLGLVPLPGEEEPVEEAAELLAWVESRRRQFGARTRREETAPPAPRAGREASEAIV